MTTRIADLPDLSSSPSFTGSGNGYGNSYMAMNVHQNPYGIPQENPGAIPPPISIQRPQQQQQHQQQLSNDQIQYLEQMTPQRLPSRDIPIQTADYQQDAQIQSNYIPPPATSDDYIKKYEEEAERKIAEYEKQKRLEKRTADWFDILQIPILVAILFFIFHMPIVANRVFKHLSFLNIYNADGNFNLFGLVLKSILFGVAVFITQTSMNFLAF